MKYIVYYGTILLVSLNGGSFETHRVLSTGDRLVLKPYQPGDINQLWQRQDHYIRNPLNGKVLDILSTFRNIPQVLK